MKQKFFHYDLKPNLDPNNFYVTSVNDEAYKFVSNKSIDINSTILFGPNKSGKTHLCSIWKNINNAIFFEYKNSEHFFDKSQNIIIDNFFYNLDEEIIFHIINHCINNNLKILITINQSLSSYKFKLNDLSSRLKSFHYIEITKPNDELIVNLLIKLLADKQIIINNSEIFSYILKRINRTYEDINILVDKIDNLSLEKKRELTIPLIKELM